MSEHPHTQPEENAELISPELKAALAAQPDHLLSTDELSAQNETLGSYINAYITLAKEIELAVDTGQKIGAGFKTTRSDPHLSIGRGELRLYLQDPLSDYRQEPQYAIEYRRTRDAAFNALLEEAVQTHDFDLLMAIIADTQDPTMAKRLLQQLNKNEEDVFLPLWAAGMSEYEYDKYLQRQFDEINWIKRLKNATRNYAVQHTDAEAKKRHQNGEIGIIAFTFSSLSHALKTGVDRKIHQTFTEPLGKISTQDPTEARLLKQALARRQQANHAIEVN